MHINIYAKERKLITKPYTSTFEQRGIIAQLPSHNGRGPSPTVGRLWAAMMMMTILTRSQLEKRQSINSGVLEDFIVSFMRIIVDTSCGMGRAIEMRFVAS